MGIDACIYVKTRDGQEPDLCDDLAPCGGEFGQCEPAYRGADLSGEHGDWAMYTSKEDACNSCAEALLRHNAGNKPQNFNGENK